MDRFAGRNGALAGLVSISADPYITERWWASSIGAISGVICTLSIKGLEKLKIDDVVGAIPAHLVCGIWGTLAASIAGGADFGTQLIGVLAVGGFVFVVSAFVWKLLDVIFGLRVGLDAERLGQDTAELGIETYPEFVLMPEEFDDDA